MKTFRPIPLPGVWLILNGARHRVLVLHDPADAPRILLEECGVHEAEAKEHAAALGEALIGRREITADEIDVWLAYRRAAAREKKEQTKVPEWAEKAARDICDKLYHTSEMIEDFTETIAHTYAESDKAQAVKRLVAATQQLIEIEDIFIMRSQALREALAPFEGE